MKKRFKLRADEIRPLAEGRGACIASDMITVKGRPVGFMYRQVRPDNEMDSGWRFMAGTEDQAYMDEPQNHGVFDVNTLANYDPSILPFLDADPGSAFERAPGPRNFRPVDDWEPEE